MRIVALALLLTVHWQGTLEGQSAGKPALAALRKARRWEVDCRLWRWLGELA